MDDFHANLRRLIRELEAMGQTEMRWFTFRQAKEFHKATTILRELLNGQKAQ